MRKRLRKKLHRGEFRELGFAVGFTVHAPAGSDAALDVIDAFIAQAIDPERLALHAGGREVWTGFITAFGRGSVSEAHKQAVLAWLNAHPRISNVRSGPLIDVWYSRDDAFELSAA